MSTCPVVSSVSNAYASVASGVGQGVAAIKKVGQEVEAGWDSLASGASAVYTGVGDAVEHTYDSLVAGAKAVGHAADVAGQAVGKVGDALEAVGDKIAEYDCGLLDVAESVAGDIGTLIDLVV